MSRASKTGIRGLYRGDDGRFRLDLRWREPTTGQRRRYCERLPAGISAAAAKQRARELLSAALAGGFDPQQAPPRRLGEALDEYEKWAKVNRPRTLRDRQSIGMILRDRLGDPPLDELNPFLVERFKRDRAAEGVAPATVNRAVAMLKHLCGLCASWGWMPEDKARAIRAVKLLREPPGRVRYLTGDEEERLLAALPSGIRPIVSAALLSGMRLGEIVRLRRDAVDLAAKMITLVRTKSNRVRRVPINKSLAAVLTVALRTATPEYVFTSPRRRKPYNRDAVTRMFHRAVERAGIKDLRFHDLRHDFATRLRRRGTGIDAIAALLGHASLAVTQRYAHIEAEVLRDAVSTLDTPRQRHGSQKRSGKAAALKVVR